jgi:hypothetical protein
LSLRFGNWEGINYYYLPARCVCETAAAVGGTRTPPRPIASVESVRGGLEPEMSGMTDLSQLESLVDRGRFVYIVFYFIGDSTF